jgi:hypothetical protein
MERAVREVVLRSPLSDRPDGPLSRPPMFEQSNTLSRAARRLTLSSRRCAKLA